MRFNKFQWYLDRNSLATPGLDLLYHLGPMLQNFFIRNLQIFALSLFVCKKRLEKLARYKHPSLLQKLQKFVNYGHKSFIILGPEPIGTSFALNKRVNCQLCCFKSAMTLSIKTLSMKTLSMKTLSIKTLSIKTLSIWTFNI
jgi:hypothetical protein